MRPSARAVMLLSAWLALAVGSAFYPVLQAPWQAAGVLIGLVLAADAWRLHRELLPEVKREVAHSLPVGVWNSVRLVLTWPGARTLRLEVFDHHPRAALCEGLPQSLALTPAQSAVVSYRIRPLERGDAHFPCVELKLLSRLGLWRRYRCVQAQDSVKVYPDFAEVTRYALLATENRLSTLGIRQRQRRGQGMEFHQLREYRDGDSLRQVDWKATARHRKMISREYQDERNQHIVFLVDCGRRMRSADGGVNHFDQALNAMLLLTYVALRQGDAVGFLAFGGQDRWMRPLSGQSAVNVMLNGVYDLQVTTQSPDYMAAARNLLTRQRKRCMVVLLSNTRDEDQAELGGAIDLLRRRHLVLFANLREAVLDRTLEQPVRGFADALAYVSAADYWLARQRVYERLVNRGAVVVDATAPQLPAAMVNRYLDVKRSGRL